MDHSQHTSTSSFLEDETDLHPNNQYEIGPNENSEIACIENLSSEPSNDNDQLLLQGNSEQEVVSNNSCRSQIDILPVEAHEESNILEVVAAFKVFHEHPKPCLLDEMYEDSHSLVLSVCYFSKFLFQFQVCEVQDEVFDEMYE